MAFKVPDPCETGALPIPYHINLSEATLGSCVDGDFAAHNFNPLGMNDTARPPALTMSPGFDYVFSQATIQIVPADYASYNP